MEIWEKSYDKEKWHQNRSIDWHVFRLTWILILSLKRKFCFWFVISNSVKRKCMHDSWFVAESFQSIFYSCSDGINGIFVLTKKKGSLFGEEGGGRALGTMKNGKPLHTQRETLQYFDIIDRNCQTGTWREPWTEKSWQCSKTGTNQTNQVSEP